MIAIFEAIYY